MAGSISSRSTKKSVDARKPGNALGVSASGDSDGEVGGVGSTYSATLTERSNKSLPSDQAERGSANPGMVPTVEMGVRRTGRVLGRGEGRQ